MSYKFSQQSRKLLNQCHHDIIFVCNELIKIIDFKVLPETIRTYEQQQEFVRTGKSKTLKSKHLLKPSQAIDIVVYPVDWTKENACYLAGQFLATAEFCKRMGFIKSSFRWGGDWNRNNNLKDETFYDLVHFEIIGN